ncbi:MAG TPA: Flp family type IVb pilin [Rhizomicrobium sp.]|nr:Flp family type IVb pilin [Rhizomicrobium sp.]
MGAPARSSRFSHAASRCAAGAAAARSHLRAFARDQRGATAIEYALLAGLITVATIMAMTTIGTTISGTFDEVAAGFTKPTT